MSMDVNIEIRGLALCFLKPGADAWTVLFACDKVHDLFFTYPKSGGGSDTIPLHGLSKLDMKIDFDRGNNNDVFVPEDPYGDDTDEIFNLNGNYSHDQALIEDRKKVKVDEVRMLVPFSRLDGHEDSDDDYFVQRQDYPGAPVFNIGQVSTMVSLKLKVEKDLTMRIKDKNGELKAFTFPYSDGSELELKFNNDCEEKCTHNDFLDLYELVRDDDNKTQFAAGKIKKPDSHFIHRKEKISTAYGNCDPSWSDPPPGP